MDDAHKQATRVEFASRFWRLLIGDVLLFVILLWICLEDRRLFHYLWIAVIPLVFLVPLLRYHRAIRSLTEPDSGNAGQAPATHPVNDAVKANIRRTAGILHWSVQTFLILLILFGLYARWGFKRVGETFSDLKMSQATSVVMSEFGPFFFNQGRELIPCTPPQSAEERLSWAREIEERLRQPVAVFVKDGASITWVTRKDSLEEGIAQVPRFFESDLNRDERGNIDTIGSYEVRRISNMLPKERSFKTWIVGPLNSDLRWGVVLDFQDIWSAYFSYLKDAELKNPPMDSPAWTIRDYVFLGGKGEREKVSMRVFQNDEVLYASPGLDTTHRLYKVDSPPMRWEYYQPDMDKRYAEFISKRPVSWRGFIGWFVLMVALFQLYHWIRKLTAPV